MPTLACGKSYINMVEDVNLNLNVNNDRVEMSVARQRTLDDY